MGFKIFLIDTWDFFFEYQNFYGIIYLMKPA